MSEFLDEYSSKPKKFISKKFIFISFLSVLIVIILGIYVGNVLFGERSYVVLKELQKEKIYLYKDIERLKKENANLQKTYLERAILDPDFKELK